MAALRCPPAVVVAATLLAAASPVAHGAEPVGLRVHPQNPRLFEFRGRPTVLLTATEHYGAVLNRPFECVLYLDDLVDKRMTLTRLFICFRELQTPLNPYSTAKPESTDFVSPYERTGPGLAKDRLPKFDLDRWNPEFFQRLRRFLDEASRRDIVVEVTLLSNTYNTTIWELNPLHPENNVNDVEVIRPEEYVTKRHANLFARQTALVQKIVAECNPYDNVLFEICNEPTGNYEQRDPAGPANPTIAEVDDWQRALAEVVRATEAELPRQHLLATQPAFDARPPYDMPLSTGFEQLPVDVVNVHQVHRVSYDGRFYDIARFMYGDLRLRGLRDLFTATAAEPKPLNFDEDNAATRWTDEQGWTVHRKRAWTTVLSGGHYDMIDFTIRVGAETGSAASQQQLRPWFKNLSTAVHALDLVAARPRPDLVKTDLPNCVTSVLAVGDDDYLIYTADAREWGEAGLGDQVEGELIVDLGTGPYRAVYNDPRTGADLGQADVAGGPATRINLPPFRHDVALRLTKQNAPRNPR